MVIDISNWQWFRSVYEIIPDMTSQVECAQKCDSDGNECTMTLHYDNTCYFANLMEINYDVLDASPSDDITSGLVKRTPKTSKNELESFNNRFATDSPFLTTQQIRASGVLYNTIDWDSVIFRNGHTTPGSHYRTFFNYICEQCDGRAHAKDYR